MTMKLADNTIERNFTEHEIYNEVSLRFDQQLTASGAHFITPMRVDLLRKLR